MTGNFGMRELTAEVDELAELHNEHHLGRDERFAAWFLYSQVESDYEKCVAALCGGKDDRDVDAVIIDDDSESVILVQSKYRESISNVNEKSEDVLFFADLANVMLDHRDDTLAQYISSGNAYVKTRLTKARKRVLRGYRLHLYFVTTGKVSTKIRREAEKRFRGKRKHQGAIQFFDGKAIQRLLVDYIQGASPPTPELYLSMAEPMNARIEGVHEILDSEGALETYVFSMRGDEIGRMYKQCGTRLFARNIRGFLGTTQVNEAMATTLLKRPQQFHYLNNGITLVCDEAELTKGKNRRLWVSNPQIINGQQTTRTLAANLSRAKRAMVLVKVIAIARDKERDQSKYDMMVSHIVAGTNWQNAIKEADLRANDKTQIELERTLRKNHYLYIRKRQKISEAKAAAGVKTLHPITKEQLAQSVAACDLDPWVARSGKDNLFKDENYSTIFPHAKAHFYLTRYWLTKNAQQASKGRPNWAYAKWLVTGFLWSAVAESLSKRGSALAFSKACRTEDPALTRVLRQCFYTLFRSAGGFYQANSGSGQAKLDVSQFYRNRKGRNDEFRIYWRSRRNSRGRAKFQSQLKQLKSLLTDLTTG